MFCYSENILVYRPIYRDNRKISIVVWITYIFTFAKVSRDTSLINPTCPMMRKVSLETLPNVNSEVKPVRLYDDFFVIKAYLICVKIVVLLTE